MQRLLTVGFNARSSAWLFAAVSLLALSATTTPAAATTWCVSQNPSASNCQPTNQNPNPSFYALPSQVALTAGKPNGLADGDMVIIDPGPNPYVDCSLWNRNITITANPYMSGQVIIQYDPSTNKTNNCYEGTTHAKGIFVIADEGGQHVTVTVNYIEFENADNRLQSGGYDAAGLRISAGETVYVTHDEFFEDQNGIKADDDPGGSGTVSVTNSTFLLNGTCLAGQTACAHGIYAGEINQLFVDQSYFAGTGAYPPFASSAAPNVIQSRAQNTGIYRSFIVDGVVNGWPGRSSYLISVNNGGNVLIERNGMEKGAQSTQPTAIGIATCAVGSNPACGPNCTTNCQPLYNTTGLGIGSNSFTNDDANSSNIYFVNNYYPTSYSNWSANVCSNTLTNNTAKTVYGRYQNQTADYPGFDNMPSC